MDGNRSKMDFVFYFIILLFSGGKIEFIIWFFLVILDFE